MPPPADPRAEIVLNGSPFRRGNTVTAVFVLNQPIDGAFTAYAAMALPDGRLLDTGTLESMLTPVAENVSGLPAPFMHLLLKAEIPDAAPDGEYAIGAAFFDPLKPITGRGDAFLDVSCPLGIR